MSPALDLKSFARQIFHQTLAGIDIAEILYCILLVAHPDT
jgi:hypothetical protein